MMGLAKDNMGDEPGGGSDVYWAGVSVGMFRNLTLLAQQLCHHSKKSVICIASNCGSVPPFCLDHGDIFTSPSL
jgi:hypothetical protein